MTPHCEISTTVRGANNSLGTPTSYYLDKKEMHVHRTHRDAIYTIFILQIYTDVGSRVQAAAACVSTLAESVCTLAGDAEVLHMCNVSRYTGDSGDTR